MQAPGLAGSSSALGTGEAELGEREEALTHQNHPPLKFLFNFFFPTNIL